MLETRLPCPVCLERLMEKDKPDERTALTLDLCPRCGGMWFDAGEVSLARTMSRFSLPRDQEPRRARCASCGAFVDRDGAECPACGKSNVLACPRCTVVMERSSQGGVILDVCRGCKGVWFDRHELEAVWTIVLATAIQRVSATHGGPVDIGDPSALLEILSYSPDLGVAIVEGSGHALGATLEVLASVPEAAGLVAEAAGAVFEVLVEVVAAILSGLSV